MQVMERMFPDVDHVGDTDVTPMDVAIMRDLSEAAHDIQRQPSGPGRSKQHVA